MNGYIRVLKKTGEDGPVMDISKPVTTLGRSTDCDIRIHLPKVSRLHATINVEGDKVCLCNESKNPIKLHNNGTKISTIPRGKRHVLSDRDEFSIYERNFRYEGIFFLLSSIDAEIVYLTSLLPPHS